MKTIFITSFHVLISRNILSTGLLDMLAKEYRIVLCVPREKLDYFRKEFDGENIFFEGIDTTLYPRDLFFRKLALALTKTKALYIKKRSQFFYDGRLFSFLGAVIPAYLCGNSRLCLYVLRTLDAFFEKHKTFGALFQKYAPALVFSTDVQNDLDVRLLQEARRARIRSVGMIRSWDNLSSKGVLRIRPDYLVVHNEIIRREAVFQNNFPEDKISVVGIPHYDNYISSPPKESRDDFFRRFGLDIQKKLIVYAPIGNRYIRDNKTDLLALETLSAIDANILVRLPPTDRVNFEGFKSRKAYIAFDQPGTDAGASGRKLNEVSRDDDESLRATLTYADVVVTGPSTISIDACVFDIPIVIIGFDNEPRVYWDSLLRYYDYDYYRSVVESRGVTIVKNPQELLSVVREYLHNPSRDRAGRERVRKEQCYLLDGQSTERLGRVLSSFL